MGVLARRGLKLWVLCDEERRERKGGLFSLVRDWEEEEREEGCASRWLLVRSRLNRDFIARRTVMRGGRVVR
jgi:hypothetical protein